MNPRDAAPGPTTMGNAARRVVAALRAGGVDPKDLLAHVGLGQVDLDNPDVCIPAAQEAQLIERSAHALGDAEFGLHIAETANLKDSGLFYFLLSSVPNARDLLKHIILYMPIENASVGWSATFVPDGGATLRLRYRGLSRPQLQQTTEYHVALAIQFVRYLTGRQITPVLVTFSHSRNSGRDGLRRYFGCAVEFSQEADGFVLSKNTLDAPIPTCDPLLFKLLQPIGERVAKTRDPPTSNYRGRVENKVYAALSLGQPRIEEIAYSMAMSARTLGRRLAEEGTSFLMIVDEIRKDIALKHVIEPNRSILSISLVLGYDNVSGFNHAFRRWTGASPSHIRKNPELIQGLAKGAVGADAEVVE